MKFSKTLLTISLLFFSTIIFSEESKNTTIVCVIDGETKENYGTYSREIKIQDTVEFNDTGVVSFKHDFLTSYDFLESQIWGLGNVKKALNYDHSVTEDEITISLRSSGKFQESKNFIILSAYWDLMINRKSGIAKTEASYRYIIDNTDVGLEKETIYVTYSGFGDCTRAANKF